MNKALQIHRGRGGIAAFAALLLVVGLPAAASGEGGGQLASVASHGGGIDLAPEVAYSRAVLTVAGDRQVYRYELAAGEGLSIGTFDPDGEPLADGFYTWELRLVPNAAEARKLQALAAAGASSDAWAAQFGSFAIIDGRIADPAAEEPTGRAAASEPGTIAPVAEPSARIQARDVDGAGPAALAASAPGPAAPAASAASSLSDSDAMAPARPPAAGPESAAATPSAVPRPDPSKDRFNGRNDLGKEQ